MSYEAHVVSNGRLSMMYFVQDKTLAVGFDGQNFDAMPVESKIIDLPDGYKLEIWAREETKFGVPILKVSLYALNQHGSIFTYITMTIPNENLQNQE